MQNLEAEDVWLRFLLRRLRLALRRASAPATATVLKEIIKLAEDRLNRLDAGEHPAVN